MSSPHVRYVPRPDATPERELNALAAVYRFILFESSASKKGGPDTAPNDGVMKGFGISEKEKGGEHAEYLPHRSSEIVH
jgi:hypothetical protein